MLLIILKKSFTQSNEKSVPCIRLDHHTCMLLRWLNTNPGSICPHQVRAKVIPRSNFIYKWKRVFDCRFWKSGMFHVGICFDLWIKVTFRGHQKVKGSDHLLIIWRSPYTIFDPGFRKKGKYYVCIWFDQWTYFAQYLFLILVLSMYLVHT